jgi:hypothetical protein
MPLFDSDTDILKPKPGTLTTLVSPLKHLNAHKEMLLKILGNPPYAGWPCLFEEKKSIFESSSPSILLIELGPRMDNIQELYGLAVLHNKAVFLLVSKTEFQMEATSDLILSLGFPRAFTSYKVVKSRRSDEGQEGVLYHA